MKKLGFGMMRLPQTNKDDPKSINFKEVEQIANIYLENEYNYFDTAFHYHAEESEIALKKSIIDKHPREKLIIADKLPIYAIFKEEDVMPTFEKQLKRTGAKYFDYYLLHNVGPLSEKGMEAVDFFKFIEDIKATGKVKNLGISSHANANYIENILKKHADKIDFIQLQLNYLDWDSESIESRKCYEIARKYNLPIIVMEPLKGGFLSNVPKEAEKLMHDFNGQSPTEWAFRFLIGLDNIIMILSGMSNIKQMENNIKIFDNIKPLNNKELEILKQVTDIINSKIAIDCTKCGYCLRVCPEKINIPREFDMYNHDMLQGDDGLTVTGLLFKNFINDGNILPSACIECGACIPQCPQHIDIPEELKKVAARFETPVYGFEPKKE